MLLLVRHGRTAHNAGRRLIGRLDVPLDALGERQAAALGASAVFAGAARVVSSPLVRAMATAQAVAEPLGLPVEADERWIEIDYGCHDGKQLSEAPPDLWAAWHHDPTHAPPGGECPAAVAARVAAACQEIWPDASERDVVVVSHVSPIKAAVAWAVGADVSMAAHLYLDTASVTRVAPGGFGPTLRSFNETQHRPAS